VQVCKIRTPDTEQVIAKRSGYRIKGNILLLHIRTSRTVFDIGFIRLHYYLLVTELDSHTRPSTRPQPYYIPSRRPYRSAPARLDSARHSSSSLPSAHRRLYSRARPEVNPRTHGRCTTAVYWSIGFLTINLLLSSTTIWRVRRSFFGHRKHPKAPHNASGKRGD
jgi:hypothetical protein